MELHRPNLVVIAPPHQGIGQPPGQPALAGPGRTLQDDIFAGAQPGEHRFQFFPRCETAVLEDLCHRICCRRRYVHLATILKLIGGE